MLVLRDDAKHDMACQGYVRFGSKADPLRRVTHVRFAPEADMHLAVQKCPLSARTGKYEAEPMAQLRH